MKKIVVFALLLSVLTSFAFAQTVTLTFTAQDDNNHYVQLSRVVIVNVSQGWQETIYYPDTIFVMGSTGIADNVANGVFGLAQNIPNPFNTITSVVLQTTDAGEAILELTDVNGRIVEMQNFASLQPGIHQFQINVAATGIYFLTVRQNGQTASVKMVNSGQGSMNRIEYQNFMNTRNIVETQNFASLSKNNLKGVATHPFSLDDQMEYVGYAVINGEEVESGHIVQAQDASQMITLQFDVKSGVDGQPCPRAATVTDFDNNTYNTVQIGQQCWMKENLRTTHYADGTVIALGDSICDTIAYRYYPNDDENNVSTYGYLYNWPAVMGDFSSSESDPSVVQGICPAGWHVPSDTEWTQLTNYVSSQIQYVCGSDSTNIAKALASTLDWNGGSNPCAVGNNPSSNNTTGFSALPAGCYYRTYRDFGEFASFWSATQSGSYYAFSRIIGYYYTSVLRHFNSIMGYGYSVRCLRDQSSK